LANDLEAAVERLIQPMEIAEPAMGQLIRQSGDVESAPITRVKDKTTGGAGETEAVPNGDVVQGDRERIEDSRARQRLLVNEANHFLDALAAENAEWVLRAPDRNGLANLIDLDAARVGAWVEKILVESDRFRLRLVRNLGLGLASAYSRIDPEKAGKLFDHLFSSPSAARVVFGKASIPLELVALFGATDHPAFDRRRADFLERAMDDATIEDVVRAAEFVGRGDWIDRWSETEITASEPSRIARALMVSGLRTSNTTSDAILGREWSPGFLASVAQTASDAYRRDGWCRTWAERALAARDGEEFWCFAELASRTADRRFESWLQLDMTTDIAWRFGRRLSSRMAQQAEKTTKERRDTLFGLTRPDNLLAAAITN